MVLILESLGNTTDSNYSTSHDNRYNLDSYANKKDTKSHEDELLTVNTDRMPYYLDLKTTYTRISRRASHLTTLHFTTRRELHKHAFRML